MEEVVVTNKSEQLNFSEVHSFLKTWFDDLGAKDIQLIENFNPTKDPNASYVATYEAKFEPSALNKARLEIWVTEKGEIGFGFESYSRLGRRINMIKNSDRFIMGIEPQFLSLKSLKKILELVAGGRIAVNYRTLPLIGLISAKAIVESEDMKDLKQNGLPAVNNLSAGDTASLNSVKFKPW